MIAIGGSIMVIKSMRELKKQPGGAVGTVITGLGVHDVIVEETTTGIRHMQLYHNDSVTVRDHLTEINDDVMCVIEDKDAAKRNHRERWEKIAAMYPAING